MFDNLLDFLKLDLTDVLTTLTPILIALVASYFLGLLIYYVYRKAFRGVVYNHSFSVTLAAMTVLTTLITLAISSNIALSLGMVGALSIVRYRTAIKDPMDILFLFWAVATGITVGAKLHYLAFIGAIIVILMLLTINRSDPSNVIYVLVVHYRGEDIGDELRRIMRGKRFKIKSKTVRKDGVELAAEVLVRNENLAFLDTIKDMESVNDVTLIQYDGEFHG
ncbi:DUF4956 domain-containing protein [bacterium]|nr:DUF4956 domain-containing protein [bacterium]